MTLYSLARSSLGALFIGWVFAYLSFAIPVKRLRETSTLMAFHHPKPSYPLHILLVPKRAIASFMDLSSSDTDFYADLVQTVQSLVAEFELQQGSYRLIVNGGDFQEIPQLHFHLICEQLPNQGDEAN
jgi:histidine triad (HIT) family protein